MKFILRMVDTVLLAVPGAVVLTALLFLAGEIQVRLSSKKEK
jgi:hypothetical protein